VLLEPLLEIVYICFCFLFFPFHT